MIRVTGFFLCVIACLQVAFILWYGTFVDKRHEQPSFDQMLSQKESDLAYRFSPGNGMYSSVILTQLNRSFIEPFLGKLYTGITPVLSQDDAYERMKYDRLPQQAFVEELAPEMAYLITKDAVSMREGKVSLVYSSFNRLQFEIHSESPALFGLSYPFTGHWKATIDGRKVPVYRANGASHAVIIPNGMSLVEFRYWSPAAFWGIVMSCMTFILIGLFVSLSALRGFQRIYASVIAVMIGVGVLLLWSHSLYSGNDLNTKFEWAYTPPDPSQKPNIAYGKKTAGYPLPKQSVFVRALYEGNFYRTHWSKVVDGDRSSGYTMNLANNPSVIIDLYKPERINSLLLFEHVKESPMNSRLLELSISRDMKQWEIIYSTPLKSDIQHPLHIGFDSPKNARYVQIKASGEGILSLDEVEIY
jgi:hypothetical protein